MGYGDEIVAAGQAQRLYDADPSTRIAIVGADGKPRWHPMWDGNPILATPHEVAAGERVRTIVNGPEARPYITYPFTKQSGWTFDKSFRCRDHIAKIYLTEQEWPASLELPPYVLIEPYTKHENFRWPLARWTELVARCPDLKFVQHTHTDSRPVPGCHTIPAAFRQACALVAHAEVYVRSESGLCHAAAAFGTRQVTLFGGCMDAEVMGYYPRQTVIADHGPGSPCGRWLKCDHCASCMDRITVDQVEGALRAQLLARAA